MHESGLAIPLVLLLFGSVLMFPLITALVAGDIVAAEDHNGTLKTILTRSVERGQMFAGKALAAATYALVALVADRGRRDRGRRHRVRASTRSSRCPGQTCRRRSGARPGRREPRGSTCCRSSRWLRSALLLSTVTRNSAAAVVGTLVLVLLIELIGILPGLGATQPYLLTRQFDAWQGLLRDPTDWAPIVRSAWVCALYGLPALLVAYLIFLRRDVAGG